MTDLDDLFRGLIDESAARRAPVDEIETRARGYRKRDRRRHRAQGFLAGAVAIALVVGTIAVVRGGDTESAPPVHVAATTTTTTTAAVHVPAGWQTYDYGLARLSIPPGWSATTGCPQARTLVMIDPSQDGLGCGAGGGGPSITIAPLTTTQARLNGSVNGIRYAEWSPDCPLQAHCGATVDVPTLKVRIGLPNVATPPILRTLTYSSYERVLQQPFGPTPRSWKTITFDGYSVRVPRQWQTFATAAACRPLANTAYYSNIPSAARCIPTIVPLGPADSVQLFGGNSTPNVAVGSHHGLRFERLTPYGPFVDTLAFVVTGGRRPLMITVGLGPEPAIARGILGSLRKAS